MIIVKFFRQQNWWYVLPCVIFFELFCWIHVNLAVSFVFATVFLISYSLKFADKDNPDFIDVIRLLLYFVFATVCILPGRISQMICLNVPMFIFFSYFYSILLMYKREMESKGQNMRKSYLFVIIVMQTIIIVGISIWATTQKIEAEKQKIMAQHARSEAEKTKLLYEESLKQKK